MALSIASPGRKCVRANLDLSRAVLPGLDGRGARLVASLRPRGPPFHFLSRKGDVSMTRRMPFTRRAVGLLACRLVLGPRAPRPTKACDRPRARRRASTRMPISTASTRSPRETGAVSVPAVPAGGRCDGRARSREPATRGRGEAYWRREAAACASGCARSRSGRPGCGRGSPNASAAPATRRSTGAAGARPRSRPRVCLARRPRSRPSSGAARLTQEDLEERARRDGALPGLAALAAGRAQRGAMLPGHAGDPGRARSPPLRRVGGPRPRAAAARPARAAAGPAHGRRGEPSRLEGPRQSRSSARCAAWARSTRASCPTASGSRAAARSKPSTTPSSRPGWAATGSCVALGGGVVGDLAGFAAAIVDARRRLGGGPDDAARDGRQLDRRQGRRSTTRGPRT